MGHKLTGTEEEYPGMGFLDRPTIGTYSPAKTRDFFTGGNSFWKALFRSKSKPLPDGVIDQDVLKE